MAQFNFPRINFNGKAFINVGTANNDYPQALMLYDMINARAYLPPLVFAPATLQKQLTKDGYSFELVTVSGQQYCKVVLDFEVPNDDAYNEWLRTRLGQSPLDVQFHALYSLVATPGGPEAKLEGSLPGEWNLNGGMEIEIHDADVVSVLTQPTDNDGSHIHTPENATGCPESLKPFLGGSFSNKNDNGVFLGSITDLNAYATNSSQFFYDGFWVRDAQGNTLMNGTPSKGMTRWINSNRTVNVPPSPMIASGMMCHAIPQAKMGTGWQALAAAFPATNAQGQALKGAFVRYSFYQIYESREPDYSTQLPGFAPNPALVSIIGSICPWYEGDMMSAPMGRLLNPTPGAAPKDITPQNAGAFKPNPLAPVTFQVDEVNNIFSADLANSLQENRLLPDPKLALENFPISTDPSIVRKFELTPVGTLAFKVGTSQTAPTLASLTVGPAAFTINDFVLRGGIFDYVYNPAQAPAQMASTAFSLWGTNINNQPAALLQESPIYIASDQNCTYFEQGPNTNEGLNQSTEPQPVYLRVFQYGQPVLQKAPVQVKHMQLKVNELLDFVQDPAVPPGLINVYDGQELTGFNTSQPMVYVSLFVPPGQFMPPAEDFVGHTEFYVNWRVLPTQDFSAYYLPNGKPDYSKLTYQALYNEIFRSFFFMFPAMTQAKSFADPTIWENRWAAGRLADRVALTHWLSPFYMPRTRDLSAAQRQLINDWAAQYM